MRIEQPADEVAYSPNETGSRESVVHRLVACVAAVKGVDPTALPPLSDWVDPDALESLFPHTGDGCCSLTLAFEDTRVEVSETGDIRAARTADEE